MSEDSKKGSDFSELIAALAAEKNPPIGANIGRPSSINSILNDPRQLRRLTGMPYTFVINNENARACKTAVEEALEKAKLTTDDIGTNKRANRIISPIISKYFPRLERALKEFDREDIKMLKSEWIEEEKFIKKIEEISNTGQMRDARLYMAFKIIDEGADHDDDSGPAAVLVPGTKIALILLPTTMDPFLRHDAISHWGVDFRRAINGAIAPEKKALEEFIQQGLEDHPELTAKLGEILKKNGYDPDSDTYTYKRSFNSGAKGGPNAAAISPQEKNLLRAMRNYFQDLPAADMGALLATTVPFEKDIVLPGTVQEWAALVILHEAEHGTGQPDMTGYIDGVYKRHQGLFEKMGIKNAKETYGADRTLGLNKAQLKEIDADIASIERGRPLISEPVLDAFVALRLQATAHKFLNELCGDKSLWDSHTFQESLEKIRSEHDDTIHGHNTGLFLHEYRKTGVLPDYFATNQSQISFYAKIAHQYVGELKDYAAEKGLNPEKIRLFASYDHEAVLDMVRRMQMTEPPIFDPREQGMAEAFLDTAATLGKYPCEPLKSILDTKVAENPKRYALEPPKPASEPVTPKLTAPNSP